MIAAGGVKAQDIDLWINAGFDGIVLGRGLLENGVIDMSLKNWLKQL